MIWFLIHFIIVKTSNYNVDSFLDLQPSLSGFSYIPGLICNKKYQLAMISIERALKRIRLLPISRRRRMINNIIYKKSNQRIRIIMRSSGFPFNEYIQSITGYKQFENFEQNNPSITTIYTVVMFNRKSQPKCVDLSNYLNCVKSTTIDRNDIYTLTCQTYKTTHRFINQYCFTFDDHVTDISTDTLSSIVSYINNNLKPITDVFIFDCNSDIEFAGNIMLATVLTLHETFNVHTHLSSLIKTIAIYLTSLSIDCNFLEWLHTNIL